jgi:CubicO group peptidase (beta-lactamase class C family)
MLKLLLATALSTIASQAIAQAGPTFRADGPNAELYGQARGYPACRAFHFETACRVGAFSDFAALFPSRAIATSAAPSPLTRAAREPQVTYEFEGERRTLDDYLNARPATGLLIARGDTILVERYQYGRTDTQLMTSFSMAKSITGLLIGIALEERAIRSIDDTAETYVPELKGSEYGRTPIKALLLMSSGVVFTEQYNNPSSDIFTLSQLTIGQDQAGSVEAVRRFNNRRAEPGKLFSYASAESSVLGLVLSRATGRPVADYASEKLWQPLGAEAGANWIVDAKGNEVTYAFYNAVLRDWARLGLMLAHGGAWNGRQIVPESWLRASTTVHPDWPWRGYGYHIWISPTDSKQFFLSGLRGQFVWVDPATKTVLVQTSLNGDWQAARELEALWTEVRALANR